MPALLTYAKKLHHQPSIPAAAAAAAAVEGWRDLVPLCRALRETLTSLRELSHFTREVRGGEGKGCLPAWLRE
jgi:hypothetical protein